MATTLVTTSLIGSLSRSLSNTLGRRVEVRRNKPLNQPLKYYLTIEGCVPEVFGPFAVHEIKSRLAMIEDMLNSGIIKKGDGGVNDQST
jgi:hypothetical protein